MQDLTPPPPRMPHLWYILVHRRSKLFIAATQWPLCGMECNDIDNESVFVTHVKSIAKILIIV